VPDDVQWIDLLSDKIRKQTRYAEEYEVRYTGERILQLVRDEYRDVYGSAVDGSPRLSPPRTGMAAIGIDALVDRMLIEGFVADPAVTDSARGVELVRAANAFWAGNDLDAMHPIAEREALIAGRAFGLVWPGVNGQAVASIESATQMAVHRQSAPPYDIDAALKLTRDEWTGQVQALLWIGGRRSTYVYSTVSRTYLRADGVVATTNWEPAGEVPNPLSLPPVVEFADWSRLLAEPTSAIEPVASLVDEADLCEALKVFAGHFGAVPIRFATGLPIPRDPSDPTGQTPLLGPNGRPVVGFNPRADHLWTSTSKDTSFGQLTPATLDGFVKWSDDTANKIRAKTAVPEFYYGTATASHINGETLKTAEAPMMRRVMKVRQSFTQSFRRLAGYGLAIDLGVSPRARLVLPRWGNPETRIEAQATDAFQKQVAAGVPLKVAMRETLGWSPELVEEAMALRVGDDALFAAELAAAGAGGDTVPVSDAVNS
jgi:hypothetical protein